MQKKISACTTVLVGKKASIDGSTMIARNEDGYGQPNPQKFIVVLPTDQPRHFKSKANGIQIELPANPLRYTLTPDVNPDYGIWGGSGINSANIAMTACETITTNPTVLAIDPFVPTGIGEADLLSLVLPYSQTAEAAVKRLGALLTEYGTYEPNGIAFADQDEVWYLETIGGHHWAAIKIPDDAYVIAPNRFNITNFDFNSTDTRCSADLAEIIERHHLNPDRHQVNLRHIFGSATEKDRYYNNPRAWYIQKMYSQTPQGQPTDHDLPFICYAKKQLSAMDVKWMLSAHFQNTPYDPYGQGSQTEQTQYRPIGLNRNEEVHILQIRNDVPAQYAARHWLAYGPNPFNGVVPFYANVTTTPAIYQQTTTEFSVNNMYWLNRVIAVLGDLNYDRYQELVTNYEADLWATCQQQQIQFEKQLTRTHCTPQQLTAFNETLAQLAWQKTNQLLGKMVVLGMTANH